MLKSGWRGRRARGGVGGEEEGRVVVFSLLFPSL
jgi:hypothetical protein